MLTIFKRITEWRKYNNRLLNCEFAVDSELHISIVGGYFSNLSTTCDFPELPSALLSINHHPWHWEPQIPPSFKHELKEIFVVPRLNKFHETQNQINKFHLLETFLSLLLQLLYHKTAPIVGPFGDAIDILEKELRFLLTILGDMSWMLRDSNGLEAEFWNILPEFEALANQAGSFVHYLFFSDDRGFNRTYEGLGAVLYQTNLLKANLQSSINSSAYATSRTSVVDSILILDSLVDDLEDLLKREDDRIADVKDQVELLHQGLMLLHSSVNDMRLPQPSEIEELKEPLRRIGGIAHQAQYLITSLLVKDAPLWYVTNRLTHLNHKIELIRTELQEITQKYQFGSLKVEKYNFSAEPRLMDKRNTEINDIIIGFEGKEAEILDQLVGGPGTESLQVISILGMAGLGKTTLAKKLYNHTTVSYRFDKFAWCVVSQTYQVSSILFTILVQIQSMFGGNLDMEEINLVQHIYQTLKGRRYLIVLDDIWDSNVLNKLLSFIPDDGNGSRILFTSRNKDVAPRNSIIHMLPFLADEQCWELLKMKAFGNRTCPPELQGIGKKIAAKCCGLPLMVVVIAGALSSVDEEERTWEEVGGSLASYIDGEDNSVMQILELSYKYLPDHLKPCFLYFGEFEEDEAIHVGSLKRLWVAEGFIRKEKDKSAEDIAGEYLLELIDRSMVMIAKRRSDGRGVKSCVVHDLLRDLCLKISKEESFLKYTSSDYQTIFEKGHRVRAIGATTPLSYCQHVHSVVADIQSSSFYVRDMRLLRVLHFKGIYGFEKHAFGVEYLVNLRYLVIDNFPTWIDRLVNLEYVRVAELNTYLPPAIVNMKKLRYLHASSVEYGEDCNSYQTNNLEDLSVVVIESLKAENLLKCSPKLRKLTCIYNPYEITDERGCPHFDLRSLTQLDSLLLSGKLIREDFGFPSNIRKLTLDGSQLPWEKMSIVGRLEFLEVLKLNTYAFVGERWETSDDEFQKLRFLQLKELDISEWNVASNEHFPKLQQLNLIKCWNLQEIPAEIGEITTLELIEVQQRSLNSLVESAERIKQEQQDMGNEELRVIIDTFQDWYLWKSTSWANDFSSPHTIDYQRDLRCLAQPKR